MADHFEFEEYRQLSEEVRNYQNNYAKLENLTFGGTIALYGFFSINIDKIPAEAWIAFPLLVGIAGTRCIGYYWVLNKRHAPYIAKIEAEFYRDKYQGRVEGFQNYISRHFPGRNSNLAFNVVGWATLLFLTVIAAWWRLKVYSSPTPFEV